MLKYCIVIALSLVSRLFYIYLAYLSNTAFEPFDKSATLVSSHWMSFLLRWDAILHYELICNGYSREHLIAFFPFYPYLVRLVSTATGIEILTSGILLTNFLFIANSVLLFKITLRNFGDKIANSAVIFYIFNAASIVNSSLYSESLYTFLFLLGYDLLEMKKISLSVIPFALSTITRSNGVLNVLFYIRFDKPIFSIIYAGNILLPFLIFQVYCHNLIGLKTLTIPYSYVQKLYWQQGLLKFYNTENIPNLVAGLPLVCFLIYYSYRFLANQRKTGYEYFLNPKNHNYIILKIMLVIQVFMCIFFIHMQMIYRFICYNPGFYWILTSTFYNKGWMMKMAFYGYFFYGIVYAILFGAYYPPA